MYVVPLFAVPCGVCTFEYYVMHLQVYIYIVC